MVRGNLGRGQGAPKPMTDLPFSFAFSRTGLRTGIFQSTYSPDLGRFFCNYSVILLNFFHLCGYTTDYTTQKKKRIITKTRRYENTKK